MWLFLKVVGLSIALAVAYGLIQDQITIRICPAYFLVFHPNPLEIHNITLLALFWGVAATWWMGLLLGIIFGATSSLGPIPPVSLGFVLRCLLGLLLFTAICTIGSGFIALLTGFRAPGMDHACSVDFAAHNASYDSAALGAAVVAYFIW